MTVPTPQHGTTPPSTPPADPAGTTAPTPPPPPAPNGQTLDQSAVDRIVQDRLARARQQWEADAAPLREKAAQLDQLAAASRTDQERAVAEATAAAERAGREAVMPSLIAAEIRAAAGGALTAEQAAAIVAPLAPAYFLGTDGNVDAGKVRQYVAGLVPGAAPPAAPAEAAGAPPAPAWPGSTPPPPAPAGGPPAPTWPGMGQGHRGTPPPAGRDAGVAEAQRRFNKPSTTT